MLFGSFICFARFSLASFVVSHSDFQEVVEHFFARRVETSCFARSSGEGSRTLQFLDLITILKLDTISDIPQSPINGRLLPGVCSRSKMERILQVFQELSSFSLYSSEYYAVAPA